jgi:hypothetical protein
MELSIMANQITVNSGTGNITVTTSRAVIGTVANVASANFANFAGEANTANSATVASSANSVTLANVSGAGNIASVNLDGNVSNVLRGDGTFSGVPDSANANFANFAGTVTNSSQPNITSLGTLGNLTVSGAIQTQDLTVTGNLSASNLNANFANFAGNAFAVDGANVVGEVANANTVSNPTQSNITSVGTLGNLGVSGTITANLIQANNIECNIALTKVDHIDFDIANGSPGFQTGRVYWDATKESLAVDMNGIGNITQQIGEDQYIYVKANADITFGQVAMFNGVVGDTILAAPANTASANFTPRYTIGIAPANIANGNFGYIQTFGEVFDLQTNAFPVGSILYLQANSNGVLTATEPTPPDPKIVLAACLTQSSSPTATNGRVQVRTDFGYYMDQLHNVSNTSANVGDVLVYNSSNVWEPSNTVPVWNIESANANISFDSAGATFAGNSDYTKILTTEPDYANFNFYTGDARILKNYETGPGFGRFNRDVKYVEDTNSNTLGIAGIQNWDVNGTFDSANHVSVPGFYSVSVPYQSSNLASSNSTTWATLQLGAGTLGFVDGSGANAFAFNMFHYSEKGIRFNRRNGNGDPAARTSVNADDYISKIEWRPAGKNAGGSAAFNTKGSFISAKVDSSYTGANAETVPQSFEINVVDSSDNYIAHSFYANGSVALNGNISANNLGNISSVNLDGSNANVLFGNGVFAAPPTAGNADSIANGNSSISFTGVDGDVSIIIDNANTVSISPNQFDVSGTVTSNLIQANTIESNVAVKIQSANAESWNFTTNGTDLLTSSSNIVVGELRTVNNINTDGILLPNSSVSSHRTEYLVSNDTEVASMVRVTGSRDGSASFGNNLAVPGSYQVQVFTGDSDLANGDFGTTTNYNFGSGFLINQQVPISTASVPLDTGAFNVIGYGVLTQPERATTLLVSRRRGNNLARLSVEPNDYLGNIEWRGGTGVGTFSNQKTKIAPRVDSTYTANSGNMPIGIDFVVTDGNTELTHSFYANGSVAFNGNISANNLGNIASVNLDGSNANVLFGNGVFAAPPTAGNADSIANGNSSVTFTGVDGDINIVVDSANTVSISPNQFDILGNITANNLGNIASVNLDGNTSNVLKGDGTFSSAPVGTSLQNGNSSIVFTGTDGDIKFKVDGKERVEIQPDGLALQGEQNDPGQILLVNSSLQWRIDNVNFSGGSPFALEYFEDTNSFIPGMSFQRTRGNLDVGKVNVEAGDEVFNLGASAYYQFDQEFGYKNAFRQSVQVLNIDAPNNFINFQTVFLGSDDGTNDTDNMLLGYLNVRARNNMQVEGILKVENNKDGFLQLSDYSVADLANISGTGGALVSVSDQDYQPAYWSQSDSVWKYVSNRANV